MAKHVYPVEIAKAIDFDDAYGQGLKAGVEFFGVDENLLEVKVTGKRAYNFYTCKVIVTYDDNPEDEK